MPLAPSVRPLRATDGPLLAEAYLRRQAEMLGRDKPAFESALRARLSRTVLERSFGRIAQDGSVPIAAVVATRAPSPWCASWSEAIVHFVLATESGEGVLARLVGETIESARSAATVFIRSRLPLDDDALLDRHTSWDLGHVVVCKRRRSPATEADDAMRIRLARDTDRAFLLDLMRRGLEEGLTLAERARVEPRAIRKAAETYLSGLSRSGAGYLAIAQRGEERLGISVVDLGAQCEIWGRNQAYVHDVYVTDAAREQGVARRLYADLEDVAFDVGVSEIAATVAAGTEAEAWQRVQSLGAFGWTPIRVSRCSCLESTTRVSSAASS